MLSIITVSIIILNALALKTIKKSVVMLSVIMLKFIMLIAFTLSVVKLSVIILSVVAPNHSTYTCRIFSCMNDRGSLNTANITGAVCGRKNVLKLVKNTLVFILCLRN